MNNVDDDIIEYGTLDFEDTMSQGKQTWLEAPTKLMLSLLENMLPKVGKSVHLKNKKKLWEAIAETLNVNGYTFSPEQVQSKFRTMERRYKKVKLNNSLTGRNKLTCPYELELENLLGERHSLNPEYVLDSENIDGKAGRNINSNEIADDDDDDAFMLKMGSKVYCYDQNVASSK
ncbi:uncharacterized protein [Musca autumnalis]|uniref:uncharacterized protein n=1 Tax=Musca autumnalis TaxID=221902 RepID=UPI003CF99457